MPQAHSQMILAAQQGWRGELIERSAGSSGAWALQELASQMLLYLDDPQACLAVASRWLRRHLAADRVDAGLLSGAAGTYQPTVEDRCVLNMPSACSQVFDLHDPLVQQVCGSGEVMSICDVTQLAGVSLAMQDALLSLRCRAKLAVALRHGPHVMGLVCADWCEAQDADWAAQGAHTLTQAVTQVIAPLLRSACLLQAGRSGWPLDRSAVPRWQAERLTPAEWRVAELVGQGLTYKEIARELGRSLSTVDHQLRSIRIKLDAPSTAKLVSMLSHRFGRAHV